MKAFICVLLVASVASQQFDGVFQRGLSTRFGKDYQKSLLQRELLEKEYYPTTYNTDYDMTTFMNTEKLMNNMMTFDEIVRTTLFREYYAIPLFRQYMEKYPVVFQKYIESPLFQKFWTIPSFQGYFRNPVLFYKYIVPQLTLVKETMTTFNYGGLRFENILEEILNKDFNKYNNYYGNNEWTTPYVSRKYNNFYPTTFNTGIYGDNSVNYKFLLEKMMAKLFNGEQINTILPKEMINTEVRAFPYGEVKEQTVGQFVDPITGETKVNYGDFKVVDEKMIPTDVMDFPVENKETLLKKYFLNKFFAQKKNMYMTPEEEVMTTSSTYLPEMYKYNPLVARIYGQENKFFAPRFTNNKMDLIKDELIKEKLIKDELIKEKLIKDELIKDELIKGDYVKDTTFSFLPIEKKMELLKQIELLNKGKLIGGEEKLINSLPIEKQMELINILKAPTNMNTFGRVPLTREQIITKDALKMKTLEKELLNKDTIIKA